MDNKNGSAQTGESAPERTLSSRPGTCPASGTHAVADARLSRCLPDRICSQKAHCSDAHLWCSSTALFPKVGARKTRWCGGLVCIHDRDCEGVCRDGHRPRPCRAAWLASRIARRHRSTYLARPTSSGAGQYLNNPEATNAVPSAAIKTEELRGCLRFECDLPDVA
jgi:hypothetical protein